jgi:AraC-like DNA-binding protein
MSKKNEYTILEYHLNRHQPDKPQFAVHDLNTYIKKHGGPASKPHIHSYYQVIWFKQGKGKHFVDFESYEVSENSIFFVAKNQVHYFDDNLDYQGILLHFNEAFFVRNENETDFVLKNSLFNNPYQQCSSCVRDGLADMLDEYISLIQREINTQTEYGKEELLRIYLKSFLLQVHRKRSHTERPPGELGAIQDQKRMQLIRFNSHVDQNFKKGLTVTEYARMLGISSRTLSDLTSQLLNKTPSQMIQERIILEVQRLLLYSDLNVNQIGFRLGFDDPSYFVKYFKKHTRMSPSEFRKSIA